LVEGAQEQRDGPLLRLARQIYRAQAFPMSGCSGRRRGEKPCSPSNVSRKATARRP
jgi:hypothetical protein